MRYLFITFLSCIVLIGFYLSGCLLTLLEGFLSSESHSYTVGYEKYKYEMCDEFERFISCFSG